VKQKGFTLFELLIVVVIISIIASVTLGIFVNNRGATEKRAKELAINFLQENEIAYKRVSCAGDSDDDGYGSCTVVTEEGEKIYLQCPCDFVSVNFWGAKSCKEIETNIKISSSLK